jgi:hypothetical protein
MPVRGLSLLGFMPKGAGMNYLKADCVGYTSARQRSDMWERARAQLGDRVLNAGCPELLGFEADHQAYFNAVVQDQQFARTVVGFRAASFVRAEIDPILAFQHHISVERAAEDDRVPKGDSMQSLLELCLPAKPMRIVAQWTPHPRNSATSGTVVLTTDSLNLAAIGGTEVPADGCVAADGPIGPILGAGSDLVQVVRVGGRCILRNGYHRAWSLRRAGHTHMPCLLLEADNYAQLGVNLNATLPIALLQSVDAPTMGHFTQGRAMRVNLKRVTRRATITWTLDYVRERP